MALQERHIPHPSPPGGEESAPVSNGPLSGSTPFVCYGLVGLSVAVFVLELLNLLPAREYMGVSIKWGALVGPLVAEGEYWRIAANWIVHHGPLHLLLNMSVVFTMGMPLERLIGSFRFALISLVAGLVASAAVLLWAFVSQTAGASGMILGWGAALFAIANKPLRRNLMTWLAQVAVLSLLPGISWQGHLGGFVGGGLAGLALRTGPRGFSMLAPLLVLGALAANAVALEFGARL